MPHKVVRESKGSRMRKLVMCLVWFWSMGGFCVLPVYSSSSEPPTNLQRAKVYLAAGDFRMAVQACLQEVAEHPSVESYVYLTYVYHALDAYLEQLSKEDKWVQVEHAYLNLAARGVDDLVDPPEVLARIVKEIVQGGTRRQADVIAGLATRLDKKTVNRMWIQQTSWRKAHPIDWWFGVPKEWKW